MHSKPGSAFYIGLTSLSASTLMYEVVLTRLLSVISWYYLAFVSVSVAMFGMTAGALAVQLRPDFFSEEKIALRLHQSVLAMAVSTPLTLLIALSIPLDISFAIQTAVTFFIFSSVISVPFFFSGVAICLALTRTAFPTGRIYFYDLGGAAFGCLGAVGLLSLLDAPSAIFEISAFLFVAAGAFADYAQRSRVRSNCVIAAAGMIVVAILNSQTVYGIQPIWGKGEIDPRTNIFAEIWNPISRVRILEPAWMSPHIQGPSPKMPDLPDIEAMWMVIDNDASTQMLRFHGDLKPLSFFRYDVTSLGAELRHGGSAAIIGVGGGRDVLNCAANGFNRIVGIEVNGTIVGLTGGPLNEYSGFSKIPGFELHNDEGRSYLTRTPERFDMIQASLVDTFAATAAGAMTLSENTLYTVNAWQTFYHHLKPGGIITFSRWYSGAEKSQTFRLFSVAYATLLAEGVRDPRSQIVLIESGSPARPNRMASPPVATILVSNRPFSPQDIAGLKQIIDEMAFDPLVMPEDEIKIPQIERIAESRTLDEMASLTDESGFDYSPTYDESPYFFNAIHIRSIPRFLDHGGKGPNLRAIMVLFAFFLAAVALLLITIGLPAWQSFKTKGQVPLPSAGAAIYFVAIGLGFMCVEMGMMQQLSILLGHPVYALIVVLAGLILFAGLGSLVSDFLPATKARLCRIPALASGVFILAYSVVVSPVKFLFIGQLLWQRVAVSLVLIALPAFALGFCFPIGLKWMRELGHIEKLPWMWALNGAAGTLGTFFAMLLSMETSIRGCVITGGALYFLAAIALPSRRLLVASAGVGVQELCTADGRETSV